MRKDYVFDGYFSRRDAARVYGCSWRWNLAPRDDFAEVVSLGMHKVWCQLPTLDVAVGIDEVIQEEERMSGDVLGTKEETLSTGEVVRESYLYCCRRCAEEDGCIEFKDFDRDFYIHECKYIGPDEIADEYGQLCLTCEQPYHFTKDL